jgi:hypothetical protein
MSLIDGALMQTYREATDLADFLDDGLSDVLFASAAHDILPCALCQCRVGVLQIGLGDLQVHGRLPGGLVFCIQEGDGFAFVFCAEAGLSAGRSFLAIENTRSPEQDESLFHI